MPPFSRRTVPISHQVCLINIKCRLCFPYGRVSFIPCLTVDGSVVKQSSRTSPLEKSVFYPNQASNTFVKPSWGRTVLPVVGASYTIWQKQLQVIEELFLPTVPRSHWLMFSACSNTCVQLSNRNASFILSRSCCSKHHLVVGVRIGVRCAKGTAVLWWAAVCKTTGRWSERPIGCMTSTTGENKSGTLVKARSKRLTGTPSEFKCVGLFTGWLILKESIKSFRAEPWEFVTSSEYQSLCFALKSPSRTMSVSAALSEDGLEVLIKNVGWAGRAIAASDQQRLVDPTVKFYWAWANLNPQEF